MEFVVNVQQEILVTEKVLVEGLRFDLLVELPYPHLLKFVKMLQGYLLRLMLLIDVKNDLLACFISTV